MANAVVAALAGSRCRKCAVAVFPASGERCRLCGGKADDVDLGTDGVVETWTQAGGALLAEVRLDSGVLVLGRIAAASVAVGDRVRVAGGTSGVTFQVT